MEVQLGVEGLIVAYGCTCEEGLYRGYVRFKASEAGGEEQIELRCDTVRQSATHAFNDALILAEQYRQ